MAVILWGGQSMHTTYMYDYMMHTTCTHKIERKEQTRQWPHFEVTMGIPVKKEQLLMTQNLCHILIR